MSKIKRTILLGKAFQLKFVISTLPIFTYGLVKQIQQKKVFTLLPATLNEIYLANHDVKIREALTHFTFLTPDGMPLVKLLQLQTSRVCQRIYGPDLLLELCRQTEHKGISHFFYGGTPEVLEKLSSRLKKQFPALTISGSYAPPFRELSHKEEQEFQLLLKRNKPDIIWIGLGSEKQITWIDAWKKRVPQSSMIGVGAAFDFLSGNKKQAPLWMQKNGLEWFFRLLSEPRRLWRRYLAHLPYLVAIFTREYCRILLKKSYIG